MIFHLPFALGLLMFIIQAGFGLKHKFKESFICAVLYTIILFGFYADHDLVVIGYMYLVMFWSVAFVTFYQRNSWRKYMKKGELEYDYEG